MGHQHQRKAKSKYAHKRHPEVAERDDVYSAESRDPLGLSANGILHLQHTIGNQAVQRLIEKADVLQRQPTKKPDAGKPKEKETSLPAFVASITGAQQGEFKGDSRIKGHEGKIVVLSLSFEPKEGKMIVHLTKESDSSTTTFHKALLTGEPLTTAKFEHIRRNDSGEIETGQTFEFSDGMVTSMQLSDSQGVSVEYITIEFNLKPKKEDGENYPG
jgi:type VI protein secretion system component Hcp